MFAGPVGMPPLSGVRPGQVFEARIASAAALAVSGTIAARQQHPYSPILRHSHAWHVPVAYVVGFMTLLALVGWHPQVIAPR